MSILDSRYYDVPLSEEQPPTMRNQRKFFRSNLAFNEKLGYVLLDRREELVGTYAEQVESLHRRMTNGGRAQLHDGDESDEHMSV